jgi:hypothetical protein
VDSKPNGAAHPADSGVNPDAEDQFPIISGAGEPDSDGSGIPTVNPSEIGGSSDASGKRGRGRPRGSRTPSNTSSKSTKQTATDLSGILMSAHMMLASFLNVEELELDQKEAERLSEAVNKVQAEYDMPILSPAQLAWINLLMTTGGLYGPRWVAYSLRMKAERKKAKGPTTIDAQPIKVM